jgi:RNA polymerase sigma-70 factor (ECF subfamily)
MKLVLTEHQYRVLLFESSDFGDIYSQYYSEMYRNICYPMSKNDPDLAKDYCQAAFIKAYEKFNKFDEVRNIKPWLARVVKNYIIDQIRSNKMKFTSDSELLGSPEEESKDPNLFMDKYTEDDIKKAVEMLSPNYKSVLKMYYFGGMSHQEIADELGISEGTSKSNLHKAKANFKKNLKKIKGE